MKKAKAKAQAQAGAGATSMPRNPKTRSQILTRSPIHSKTPSCTPLALSVPVPYRAKGILSKFCCRSVPYSHFDNRRASIAARPLIYKLAFAMTLYILRAARPVLAWIL